MKKLSEFSNEALQSLRPFTDRYDEREADESDELRDALLKAVRAGSFGVLRDLHTLYVMASQVHVALA